MKVEAVQIRSLNPQMPPTIAYALERIAKVVTHPHKFGFITFSRPGKPRLMRLERRESLLAVLDVLVRHMDIATGRIVRPLGQGSESFVFADCSLNWLAAAAGVSHRTLCRVIVDLESVGWLKRESQAIAAGPEPDTLTVATVIRRLTSRFFTAIGLAKSLARDQQFQQTRRNGKIIKSLIRVISARAKVAWYNPVVQAQKSIQHQLAELSAWMGKQPTPG